MRHFCNDSFCSKTATNISFEFLGYIRGNSTIIYNIALASSRNVAKVRVILKAGISTRQIVPLPDLKQWNKTVTLK